jgi:Tfp pilus assembly protein PilF/predicted secreted protein
LTKASKVTRTPRPQVVPRTSRPQIGWIFLLILILSFGCKKNELPKEELIHQMLTHRNLGLAYLEESRLTDAEKEFKALIDIATDEALGYADLGLTYLRLNRYAEAEKFILKALQYSDGPEIHLLLAETLDRSGKKDDAIQELEKSVRKYPQYASSEYKLAQCYLRTERADRFQKAEINLKNVVASDPTNLTAKLQLTEVLIRNKKFQEAVIQLREIRQFVPEFPQGSETYLDQALQALFASNGEDALRTAIAFHNFLKPMPLYQAAISELNGPGGALFGFPVLHFGPKFFVQIKNQPLSYIRFTDATAELPSNSSGFAMGDFDLDGSVEFFFPKTGSLLRNKKGKFVPAATIPQKGLVAKSIDFNNDGKLDLCVLTEKSLLLLENRNGTFQLIKEIPGTFSGTLFMDLDNEGDLDLYTIGESKSYRNNGDDTFADATQSMRLEHPGKSSDAAFGDFDDDGDLDLFVTFPDSSNALYTNLRQGQFQDIASQSGIAGTFASRAVAVADYDSNGFLDILITGQQTILFRNKGNGQFEKDNRSTVLNQIHGNDAAFIDFDNDGFQDIVIAGEKTYLLRNDGSGIFSDASSVFSVPAANTKHIDVADYDSDGDLDLFLTDTTEKVHLFNNDGGNANHWLKVALVGLGIGSGKNNRFGIGAKVEVKAGDLYQLRVATEPVTHFGLGSRSDADVLRTVWTNGVPQNHFHPQSNQVLLEKQILKGSCPFLYAWDGQKFEFVTDVLWKSALGMPLGIMSGEPVYAFPNSADEFLKISGSQLKEKDGYYTIQLTEELWETPYFDKVRLVAVDHPNTTEFFIDEKFVVPPVPPLKLYPVMEKIYPILALDQDGQNVLRNILEKDDSYVSNLRSAKYQGITSMHDLTLDLGKFDWSDDVTLFLRGWIFPTDASINVALSQSQDLKLTPPSIQVHDRKGKWQTVIPSISFPMGKDKTMIVDLTGKFLSEDHRIRIATNMEIYWDEIFYTKNEPSFPMHITSMNPASGDLHYRGFSRTYRKNLLGPQWFDYSQVDRKTQWRDLEGNYTRYGDVTPLLQESDDLYVIFNSGDEITIQFDAKKLPPLPRRWTRDFLIYCDGWLKDGDHSTAYGQTVEPLPFHGIKSFPPSAQDHYPLDQKHQNYLKTYNTRKVYPKS